MSQKGGWSDQEMRNTVKSMASLIECEIKKFETTYKIVMESEPPIELDAEILLKKLLDRGTLSYDGAAQTSPVLEQVILSLVKKLDDLIYKNPVVEQILNDTQGRILRKERDIFVYRLSLINAWALVILDEIHFHSRKVYEVLDDWIVEAVAQENQISNHILSFLKDSVHSEQIKIEEYQTQLANLSLFSKIQTVQFNVEDTALYLQNIHIPTDDIEANRFNVEQLRGLYIEMRSNIGDKGNANTLDSESFVNMMMLAFR